MDKKICIISANCQGAYIKTLLENHIEFSKDFNIYYFVNYQKEKIPEELLKKADILIYQPVSAKWSCASEDFLINTIKKDCLKVKIAYLTFPIYWPFFTNDPRNIFNSEYPFGQFPYGDKFILDLIRKGTVKEKIFNLIKTKDYLKSIDIGSTIQNYIAFQKDLENRRDQKLLDFIIDNFREVKLFESYNHPSVFLAEYQVNDLLEKIGYRKLMKEEIPKNLEIFLQMFQLPIHPFIAEALKLKFDADWHTEYKIWYKPMKAIDYYKAYIYWDTTAIGSPRYMPCKNEKDYKKILTTKENGEDNNINENFLPNIKDINLYKKNIIGKQLVFVHIPKTGGISIHKMLSKALFGIEDYKRFNSMKQLILDPNRRLYQFVSGHFFFDCYKILSEDVIIITFLRNPVERTISAFEFMKAHPEVWLGKLAQGTLEEFLLNEFVQKSVCNVQTRLLGLEIDFEYFYSQFANKKITEEDYFEIMDNFIISGVTEKELNRAKENLNSLFFFGFTETLSQDIKTLFSKLGLEISKILHENRTPNHVRKRDKYTAEEIQLIMKYNKYDIELYNYAITIHKEKKE